MSEPSTLLTIADAVKTELAGAPSGTFSQTFAPVRRLLPRFDLEELKDIRVVVVPVRSASERIGRGLTQTDYTVDVAVMQHQEPDASGEVDDAKADAIVRLGEEIEEFFSLRHLKEYPDALWVGAVWNPDGAPFAAELLETKSVVCSILALTFRVMRQKQE